MRSPTFKLAAALSIFVFAGTANANEPMKDWENRLRTKIAATNSYPTEAINEGAEGTVKMRLKFAQTGNVEGVELVEKSGFEILDRKAFQMALRIQGMPALPEGRKQISLIVPLTFSLTDNS
ncbi:energy transducer TonB [Kordiimonas aquimaris]|uniref:energy transducer TonB n=1 Tax=Kordiimonas aquimaris TaxID=707591 RepID=UPI0021D12D54|nr:energy transducer TonB [Kordiimonas aquimaris]